MIIFAIFSLIAGVLTTFLPETKDIPLPETFRDALMFTENAGKYDFYGLDDGKSSASLVGKESTEGVSTIVPPVESEDRPTADKDSTVTTTSQPRRSETFTELAPISEVHEHEEAMNSPRSITPTAEDFSVPIQRKRHNAGSCDRKVSKLDMSANDNVDSTVILLFK